MTIKQLGGIFGRNPSFADVAFDNLDYTSRNLLNQFEVDPIVLTAGAGYSTFKTFTTSERGSWFITLDQGYLHTTQQHWYGYVLVGANASNGLLISSISSVSIGAQGSGLSLQFQNTGGSDKTMTLRGLRLSNP